MKHVEERYQELKRLNGSLGPQEMRTELEQIIADHPDFAKAHNDLGILYHQVGDIQEAQSHLVRAAELEPDNVQILKNLADFYHTELGDKSKALAAYEKILVNNPIDLVTLMICGHLCVSQHQFEQAKGYYTKIVEIEPWNAEAADYIHKIEELDLNQGAAKAQDSFYQAAQAFVESGNLEAAIGKLEELLQLQPDSALVYNDLGVLYFNLGQKVKAGQCYEKAVTLSPENVTYLKNLADFLYVESQQTEKALELYAKALAIKPTDIEILMAAGYISNTMERTDDARLFFERVLDIEPWNLEAGENLEKLRTVAIDGGIHA